MKVGPGDALFGRDGTDGDPPEPQVDGIGPLPGLDIPLVRLPTVGPDGEINGLDDLDADLDAAAGSDVGSSGAVPPADPEPAPPAKPRQSYPDVAAYVRARFESAPSGTPLSKASKGALGPPHKPTISTRPALPPRPEARPRVVDDTVILGLSRHSRSRVGSRLFTLFFVFVFALILVQMVVALLSPTP